MGSPSAPAATRLSAGQRREQLVEVALEAFAAGGYHGTSTEAIARAAGISQPYLFRLFGTKKELFLACVRLTTERILETFRSAAADAPEDVDQRLALMGVAFWEMLADRTLLLAQLQNYVAAADPEIREVVRAGYGEIYVEIERLSGAGADAVRAFVAHGMLLTVANAIGLPEIIETEPWAQRVLWNPHEQDGA